MLPLNKFRYFFILYIILNFISCNSSSKTIEAPKEAFLVRTQYYLGDSVLADKTKEHLAFASVNGENYIWEKQYFYIDQSTGENVYLDNSIIDCNINKEHIVTKINNWDNLYYTIKNYVDSLYEETPLENKTEFGKLLPFILDSSAIANKNTKEIQIFHIGYELCLNKGNESSFNLFDRVENESVIISKARFNLETASYETLLNNSIGSNFGPIDSSFSSIKIVQNTKDYSLFSISHSTNCWYNNEQMKELITIVPYYD